jgi:hypothetical protein
MGAELYAVGYGLCYAACVAVWRLGKAWAYQWTGKAKTIDHAATGRLIEAATDPAGSGLLEDGKMADKIVDMLKARRMVEGGWYKPTGEFVTLSARRYAVLHRRGGGVALAELPEVKSCTRG